MPDLGCSPNAAIAYDFLVGKGLRDFQAAAVVGNLQQESTMVTRLPYNPEGSIGIAQWRLERRQRLEEFARAQGRDVWSLDLQLDFLWHELQTTERRALSALEASTTIEEATVAFQDLFERPSKQFAGTQKRIDYARSALFACPAVRPPPSAPTKKSAITAGRVGVFALVAAVSYGVYKAVTAEPKRESAPLPPRVFPQRAEPPERFYYRP